MDKKQASVVATALLEGERNKRKAPQRVRRTAAWSRGEQQLTAALALAGGVAGFGASLLLGVPHDGLFLVAEFSGLTGIFVASLVICGRRALARRSSRRRSRSTT